jgi:hypothetical protein
VNIPVKIEDFLKKKRSDKILKRGRKDKKVSSITTLPICFLYYRIKYYTIVQLISTLAFEKNV